MAHAPNGFDEEWLGLELLGEVAQRQDTTVERVISDRAAVPALVGQLVARYDARPCLRQRDEHLHNPSLKFAMLAAHLHLAMRRPDEHVAQLKFLFGPEINS